MAEKALKWFKEKEKRRKEKKTIAEDLKPSNPIWEILVFCSNCSIIVRFQILLFWRWYISGSLFMIFNTALLFLFD